MHAVVVLGEMAASEKYLANPHQPTRRAFYAFMSSTLEPSRVAWEIGK